MYAKKNSSKHHEGSATTTVPLTMPQLPLTLLSFKAAQLEWQVAAQSLAVTNAMLLVTKLKLWLLAVTLMTLHAKKFMTKTLGMQKFGNITM